MYVVLSFTKLKSRTRTNAFSEEKTTSGFTFQVALTPKLVCILLLTSSTSTSYLVTCSRCRESELFHCSSRIHIAAIPSSIFMLHRRFLLFSLFAIFGSQFVSAESPARSAASTIPQTVPTTPVSPTTLA